MSYSLMSSRSKIPSLLSTVAANAESRILVLLTRHTAHRDGESMQRSLSTPSCLWKLSTPESSPASWLMLAASSVALCWVSTSKAFNIAAESLSAVSCLWGMGAGPAPAFMTIEPQNCWSPKNGITTVGLPHATPIAVVPAPPWCTTHDTCLNSQSCGQLPIMKTPSGIPNSSTPSPPQP